MGPLKGYLYAFAAEDSVLEPLVIKVLAHGGTDKRSIIVKITGKPYGTCAFVGLNVGKSEPGLMIPGEGVDYNNKCRNDDKGDQGVCGRELYELYRGHKGILHRIYSVLKIFVNKFGNSRQ